MLANCTNDYDQGEIKLIKVTITHSIRMALQHFLFLKFLEENIDSQKVFPITDECTRKTYNVWQKTKLIIIAAIIVKSWLPKVLAKICDVFKQIKNLVSNSNELFQKRWLNKNS